MVGLLAAAGLAAAATLSFGQGSTSSQTLTGCVHRSTGKLRLTPPGPRCTRRERRVTWNERGRDGAAGAAGPAGAGGAGGAPGADGAKGARGDAGSFGFDNFDGMPCTRAGSDGVIDLTYDPNGYARLEC